MQIPHLQFPTQPLEAAQESVKHVPQHVPSVKGDHRDEVGEAQQNVDPKQPEEQIRHQQQHVGAEQRGGETVARSEQGFLKGVDGNTVHLEGNDQHGEDMQRNGERPLAKRPFPSW